MHPKHKGQSTVEYILLVTAIMLVGIVFVIGTDPNPDGSPSSEYQKKINKTYSAGADGMQRAAGELFSSILNTSVPAN